MYYKKRGESEENIKFMHCIERIYSKDPTLGYRRMKAVVGKGDRKNDKQEKSEETDEVTRVKRDISQEINNMIQGKVVTGPNQVWIADITYILG